MIPGPAGVIEGLLEAPDAAQGTRYAVVCHPHPLHGGTMQNKVAHTLARALVDCGMPTLRFNFRGVGASAGLHDDGRGEIDDALAVVAHGAARFPGARPWLAGFSFGAVIALHAAVACAAERRFTGAPPVARLRAVTAPLPTCPWLLLQGDQDEVIDAQDVVDWGQAQRPQPDIVVLEGAGHFFHGRLQDLRETVLAFAGSRA